MDIIDDLEFGGLGGGLGGMFERRGSDRHHDFGGMGGMGGMGRPNR